MAILPMLVMDQPTAQALAQASAIDPDKRENLLAPRRIDAGPQAGSYVLPIAVLTDPAFAAEHDMLAPLPIVQLDTDAAWPEQE